MTVSNLTECGPFRSLFPSLPEQPVPSLETEAAGMLLQGLPSLLTILVWGAIESRGGRKKRIRFSIKALTYLLSLLCIISQFFLIWRTFDLMECEDEIVYEDAKNWRVPVGVGGPLVSAALLFVLSPILPRVTALVFALLAGGVLFLDWVLRGGYVLSIASYHLVALQQTIDILLLCCLISLPLSMKRRVTFSLPGSYFSSSKRDKTRGTSTNCRGKTAREDGCISYQDPTSSKEKPPWLLV